MKKTFLLKTMFLLCALVTWGNAWAADFEWSLNALYQNGTIVTAKSVITSSSGSLTFNDVNNNFTLVVTKHSSNQPGFYTSSGYFRFYSSDVVTISAPSGVNMTKIVITPNGSNISLNALQGYDSSKKTWEGTANSVSFTGSGTNKWDKITIYYETPSPVINADDVNIAADVLAGNINYSVSNPDGSTMTAAKKSGDWLTVGDVDAVNNKVAFTATENTGAARDAVVTLTYGTVTKDVTITQTAAVAKYAVSFSAPTNGTMTIKRDDVTLSSGDEVATGSVLTILTTPNDGYNFVKWEYSTDGGTSWNDGVGTSYTVTSAVSFRASFVAKIYHTITYSVNGVKNEVMVEEGEPISFAAPTSVPAGYVFKGWSEVEIITPQVDAPAMVSSAISTADITYYAVIAEIISFTPESWTETPLASMTASDVFVFSNGSSAMTNDNGTTDAPATSAITVSAGQITSTVADNIKWNVSGNSTVGYTFYPNGSTTTWLYCNTTAGSGSNNNIRVGTGNRKAWVINTGGYLVTNDESTERYLSIYNDQDFRGYINTNSAFIPKFYKHIAASETYGNYCTKLADVITVSAAGWATYCSEYALDFTGVTELTAYTATKEGGAVKFNKVTGKVPANTGLLVSGTTANVPVAASADAVINILEGVTAETVKAAGTVFVLKQGANGLGFYKNTNDFTVRANSAYLPATAVAGARAFIALDDEATGIENLAPVLSKDEGVVYDLSGRRVVTPTKGLYIVNGKKVIVK